MAIWYSPSRKSLIYIEKLSSPEFWDQYWDSCKGSDNSSFSPSLYERSLVSLTNKYLPHAANVVEAGCGSGRILLAHSQAGYRVHGIDYAPRTVRALREAHPALQITEGDIRKTPYGDSEFDGYWSIGVIEHFWHGYSDILVEASRILAPNGYAFISFPYMNYIRRLRAFFSLYRCYDQQEMPENFFQFALTIEAFLDQCARVGFQLVDIKYFSSLQRNLVDIGVADRIASRLSDSRKISVRAARISLRLLFSSMHVNHSALCVLQKHA